MNTGAARTAGADRTVTEVGTQPERARKPLIVATRELMLAAAVTDMSQADIATATESITAVTELLRGRSRERCVRPQRYPTDVRRPGAEVALDPYNPAAVPLRVTFPGDDTASAELVGDALLEGPPDSVHGGISAWLMDMMLGTLVQSLGVRAMTGTLDMRYLRQTPLEQPLQLGSEVLAREGRKITVRGWIDHQGARCVEATGLFIEVAPR